MSCNPIILLLLCSSLLLSVTDSALAAPPFDLDYELQVGVDATRYEIWVDPPDGDPYMYSYYYTRYEASCRLFKLVDYGVIPPGADAWIEQATYTKWTYWNTYEELESALEIADAFDFAGLETKIVPVFGGYHPTLSPWEFSEPAWWTSDESRLLEEENRRIEDLIENAPADRG